MATSPTARVSALTGSRASPATTPVSVSPSTMMASSPNRSTSAAETISVAASAGGGPGDTAPHPARETGSPRPPAPTRPPGRRTARPAGAGRQDSGAGEQDGAGSGPGHVQQARPAVYGPVAARGQQPQHGQHREQHSRGDGERRSPRTARLGDEGAHRDQHQDLQQERAAGASVVVAVQLVVETAVGPGDPYQREHHGELAQAAPCQVPA